MSRPFCDPGDRYSYEDWMNEMATQEPEPRRVVKRWRGRVFVYLCDSPITKAWR